MSRASTSILRDGVILNNRYRIVRQLGRGGFGRAYLAEDNQRYRELCVLKEFAPQVESDRELRQAEDLFEREAGILYKLEHSQIPRFEALLRTRIESRRSLFIVQEYVEGMSYWELLRHRGSLNEADVLKMMQQILPVLDYIHDADLVHRDISPDNLILRERNNQPVLIDFGCVKLAANAVSRSRGKSVTLIGKKGYSPHEQLSRGHTDRTSDLYALAVTCLVLLTGKQPDELYDRQREKWDWSSISIGLGFKKVLQKMLSERPRDRYQSAAKVSQALSASAAGSVLNGLLSRFSTKIVATSDRSQSSSIPSRFTLPRFSNTWRSLKKIPLPKPRLNPAQIQPWQWGVIAAVAVLLPGTISFTSIVDDITLNRAFDFSNNATDSRLNSQEVKLQENIQQRVESLNLEPSVFYDRVDSIFHAKHPRLVGVQLTEEQKYEKHRHTWYQIANSLLNQRERTR